MAAALRELAVDVPPDAMASSIVEYSLDAVDGMCDSAEAWTAVVCEVCSDLGVLLKMEEEHVDEAEEEAHLSASDIIAALQKCGALQNRPPPLPAPRTGDPVLAVLDEDGEWHAAVVAEAAGEAAAVAAAREPADGGGGDSSSRGGPPTIVVRFLEWPKLQRTKRVNVVPLAAATADDADDDDDDAPVRRGCGEGACELCDRRMALTFHHLVPRATHARYVGKAVPPGLPPDATPTRLYLGSYGVMLCRPCHSVVHRHAPNAVLAQRFNSLERLQGADSIAKWVTYARSRCC